MFDVVHIVPRTDEEPQPMAATTDNLHRELAPISTAAWAEIEQEARRTFAQHLAGRRVVDLAGPDGPGLSAVGTGHVREIAAPAEGVLAKAREAQHIVELRVPFTVDRSAVDDVQRGAADSDWQPVKDAARRAAYAEDRAVFEGYPAGGIQGVHAASSNPPLPLPADVRELPNTVSQALTTLRLAGVEGPYALLLGAEAYTAVNETSDHGYPIRTHIARLLGDSDGAAGAAIVWAPAITGGYLLSTRGGDFELHLGQDLSIGYTSHDEDSVALYFQESLTFFAYTSEAVVALESAVLTV
jgi:uncharacterized linocin/CFP29 family protein